MALDVQAGNVWVMSYVTEGLVSTHAEKPKGIAAGRGAPGTSWEAGAP